MHSTALAFANNLCKLRPGLACALGHQLLVLAHELLVAATAMCTLSTIAERPPSRSDGCCAIAPR